MDIANLVLEFIKVLIWPAIVVVLAVMFKSPLSELLRKIRKIGFAGGSLDADADAASSAVDEAKIDQVALEERAAGSSSADAGERVSAGGLSSEPPPTTSPDERDRIQPKPTSSGPEDVSLNVREFQHRDEDESRSQFYEQVRQLAVVSPQTSVREAYQRVRLRAITLLQNVRPDQRASGKTLGDVVEKLSEAGLTGSEAPAAARKMDEVARSARSADDLSPRGALSFVDAAQKLESLLENSWDFFDGAYINYLGVILPEVERAIERSELPDGVTASVSEGGIVIRFPGLRRTDLESDPAYHTFAQELRSLIQKAKFTAKIRYDGGVRTFRP